MQGSTQLKKNGANRGGVEVVETDVPKVFLGQNCQLIKLKWKDFYEEEYWYNRGELGIEENHFQQHNFEYFNEILSVSKAFPFEWKKSISSFVSVKITLREYEAIDLDDDVFTLPEMKKSNRKEDRLLYEMTGNKMMKVKG